MKKSTYGDTLEERQALLDRRTRRFNKKKRHGKNKRRSRQQREKARIAKARAVETLKRVRRVKGLVASYWRGERDDLSGLPG